MTEEEPTTPNGTTLTEALSYAGEEGLPTVKAGALLRDAERFVRDVAPPPVPKTDAYRADARDAELYTFGYYVQSPGYISSASLDGVSVNFVRDSEGESPALQRVRSIMSRWIRGAPPRATVSRNAFSNVLEAKDKW